MLPLTFRTIRKRLAPRWLTDGAGGLVGYSLDLVKDAFIERLRLGKLAHFPQVNPAGDPAPHDALVLMGRDRRVFRAIDETETEYAARLLPWLDDRRTTGNPFTLMKRLADYVGPLPSFRTVDDRGNWFARAADGTETYSLDQGNWNWDDRAGTVVVDTKVVWSRFWVIIYPNGLWTEGPGAWGDADTAAWGAEDGLAWGSTATSEQCATLRAIVKDSMPLGTKCVNIILAFDASSFDPTAPEPDGKWGHWGKTIFTGVNNIKRRVPARLATARYIDGVS